jgi:hypothetical protein
MTAQESSRCPSVDLKGLEDRVRRWKQAGYQTFSISVDEMLDIIDRCASHSNAAKSSDKVLEERVLILETKMHEGFLQVLEILKEHQQQQGGREQR